MAKGFAFPRRFKSAASLLPTLTRNNRELTNFLNSFVVRFDSDGLTLTLGGDVSVAGNLSGLNWSTWTPTISNLTLGNGTQVARYVQIGQTVHAWYSLVFGSTSSISGEFSVSYPVAPHAGLRNFVAPIGVAKIDDSGSFRILGHVSDNGSNMLVRVNTASGTYVGETPISSTVPMTWTTNDELSFGVTFEAA